MANSRLNKFHGNFSSWVEMADVYIDYFTLYTKAWIAFNAWFSSSYPNENTDIGILNKIKKEVNPFRKKIMYYLNGNDDSSKKFRCHIAKLHYELDRNPIPSLERKITFTNVILEKNTLPTKEEIITGRNYSYKIRVSYNHNANEGTQKVTTAVFDLRDANNAGRMNYNQNEWDIEELKNHPQFNLNKIAHRRVKKIVQQSIINCYNEINPLKPTNLLVEPKLKGINKVKTKPNGCLDMDSQNHIYFIDKPDKIISGLIGILYDLRNKLFHGEIEPSDDVQNIYREAYFILYTLIKSLN